MGYERAFWRSARRRRFVRLLLVGVTVAVVLGAVAVAGNLVGAGDRFERLVARAVLAVFNRTCSLDALEPVVEAFEDGLVVETGDRRPAGEYVRWMREIPGLEAAVRRLGALDPEATATATASGSDGGSALPTERRSALEAALVASAVELVLEGLHLQRRLAKDRLADAVVYRR